MRCLAIGLGLFKTVWPSGLRRWLKAPFRKGVGSNPTAVNPSCWAGVGDADAWEMRA